MRKLVFSLMSGVAGSLVVLLAATSDVIAADTGKMSFFITSVGPGNGADLGGLEGADGHCQKLASSAGAGERTWRAYLSTQGRDFKDESVVNARDRIGSGPWYNAKGVMIASNVDELHSTASNLNKETALDENGNVVNGRTAGKVRPWSATMTASGPSIMPGQGRGTPRTCPRDAARRRSRVPAATVCCTVSLKSDHRAGPGSNQAWVPHNALTGRRT